MTTGTGYGERIYKDDEVVSAKYWNRKGEEVETWKRPRSNPHTPLSGCRKQGAEWFGYGPCVRWVVGMG